MPHTSPSSTTPPHPRSRTGAHARATPSIEELLLDAAREVHRVELQAEPWVYGWSVDGYRNSGTAALPSQAGPVGLSTKGIAAFEVAVKRLLREPAIQRRWDPEEFWGLIATTVVTIFEASDREAAISMNLDRIREAGPSLVVLPIANVSWRAEPRQVADGILGRLDRQLISMVESVSGSRPDFEASGAREWIRSQTAQDCPTGPCEPVVAVKWTASQQQRAFEEAERWFEHVCCLALLLDRSSETVPPSLRGAHNRPGVRGIVPDRTTFEELLATSTRGQLELGCEPLVSSSTWGTSPSLHWYSADPLPLDELLSDPDTLKWVADLLKGSNVLTGRLGMAARWYAAAHWAEQREDAALSLGVALDAIVGTKSGLPSKFMAQRFAHLELDATARREALNWYNRLNEVRSAAAHGGRSSRLDEKNFIRRFANTVQWAAWRLIALASEFEVRNKAELEDAFQQLALGERTWQTDAPSDATLRPALAWGPATLSPPAATTPIEPCGAVFPAPPSSPPTSSA
ncbi:MAG: HEPN domain-containing protein [Acidimicrobiaceae bacterium]|nr:HEPN domain-containing protein [Acidimicrobiaceae bacterium]